MKIIITSIILLSMQFNALCQANIVHVKQPLKTPAQIETKTFFVSPSPKSSNSDNENSPLKEHKNVVITGIPSSTLSMSSVIIDINETGVFTFSKDVSLKIPYNNEVFIEDKLSGKVFNLSTSTLYKFNVDQYVPNRFVMHVLTKTNLNEAVTLN